MNWWLKKLVQGLTCRDWVFVLRLEELRQNIYLVESLPSGPSAYHPTSSSELPWFVVLLLGAFSKKHIFTFKPLTGSLLRDRVADFRNRVKWSVAMKNECCESSRPLVPRRVRECKKFIREAVVKNFTQAVERIVYKRCSGLLRVRSKLPPFVRFARSWLSNQGLCCLPSDKDGVFALAPLPLINDLVYSELRKPCYRAYGPANLEADLRSAKAMMRAAGRRAECISGSWAREITSFADSASEKSLVDSLLATIKTHKVPVSVRLIHSSTNSCFNGLGEALNRVLKPRCEGLEHLCVSSEQVASRLQNIQTGPRTLLLKQDIKDFYLTGSHSLILETVTKSFEGRPEHDFVVSALQALLPFQFVRQSFDRGSESDTIYRVQQGCGIGKNYAGALADWLFYLMVEKSLLERSCELGLQLYLRFRDDLLTVLVDLSFSPPYRHAITTAASIYCTVGIEQFSLVGVPFLDLMVYKHPSDGPGRLRHCAYIKPTARHVPLASSSYHHPAIHRSWPVAEIQRMARRCDGISSRRNFQQAKLDRFKWFLLDPSVLEACKAWKARTGSLVAQHARKVVDPELLPKTCRLVLPYRKELCSLPGELQLLWKQWQASFTGETGLTLDLRISWSKGGSPLASILKLW